MTDKIEIKEYVGEWKKVSLDEACEFYQKLSSQLKKMVFEYHFRGITEAEIKDTLKGVMNENQEKKKFKKLVERCGVLELVNKAQSALIEEYMAKIEKMEETLEKIKADVQEVKETGGKDEARQTQSNH